jgi:hypothetical protein
LADVPCEYGQWYSDGIKLFVAGSFNFGSPSVPAINFTAGTSGSAPFQFGMSVWSHIII